MAKNRLEDFWEETPQDKVEDLIRKFTEEHPEVNMTIMKAGLTPTNSFFFQKKIIWKWMCQTVPWRVN